MAQDGGGVSGGILMLAAGRFLCGWACHGVASQDLYPYLLRNPCLAPSPLLLRPLAFVPFVIGFAMFAWPMLDRWPRESPAPSFEHRFATTTG